jgi:hypothetical protein
MDVSLISFRSACAFLWAISVLIAGIGDVAGAAGASEAVQARSEKLLKEGGELSDNQFYLEALDVLVEARDFMEAAGGKENRIYAEILFVMAQTKIKARLHRNFPANYVKTALEDVKTSNRILDRLPGVLPQKIAQGYFLEGFIQKKFFMRRDKAIYCFNRAVKSDPGFSAAKRELSELVLSEEPKKD